ncbi:hypothetical protein L1267_20315 [Pseudoalteromonas sp. OFAV1]|uniref:hypothetical protein n=1 Tax=Pseudoalteromonas sp. OFAV1 TaxID=2908892 RepID=UPI001F4449CC|nr:hypothetical protein [Pseudoalteromonas sp. OFAV1]MCF2902718.1 hypothetical protein [Pseudoalteromonas sp. OFAV1]
MSFSDVHNSTDRIECTFYAKSKKKAKEKGVTICEAVFKTDDIKTFFSTLCATYIKATSTGKKLIVLYNQMRDEPNVPSKAYNLISSFCSKYIYACIGGNTVCLEEVLRESSYDAKHFYSIVEHSLIKTHELVPTVEHYLSLDTSTEKLEFLCEQFENLLRTPHYSFSNQNTVGGLFVITLLNQDYEVGIKFLKFVSMNKMQSSLLFSEYEFIPPNSFLYEYLADKFKTKENILTDFAILCEVPFEYHLQYAQIVIDNLYKNSKNEFLDVYSSDLIPICISATPNANEENAEELFNPAVSEKFILQVFYMFIEHNKNETYDIDELVRIFCEKIVKGYLDRKPPLLKLKRVNGLMSLISNDANNDFSLKSKSEIKLLVEFLVDYSGTSKDHDYAVYALNTLLNAGKGEVALHLNDHKEFDLWLDIFELSMTEALQVSELSPEAKRYLLSKSAY